MKRIILSATLAVATAMAGPALAERATLLVIDESGSMWAQLPEGRSRIEVARDVLSDFLTDRDPAQPLGVIAYGHNRKGDCADIEVIAPVGPQDGAALAARLRGLMPQGKTPLADALRLAGQSIPRTAEEADIVLITDGLESCGGDPCAVAAELRAQGIPVRAHVVGFGLTEGEVQQIACVAETTGGQVLLAQSGDGLAKALTTVDLPPATVTLSLRPVDAATGHVLGAVDWALTSADGQDQGRATDQGIWSIEIPPGAYQVVAKAPGHAGGLSLKVTAQTGGVIDVPLEATHALLALIALDADSGDELFNVNWTLTRTDGTEITLDTTAGPALVLPGAYRITGRLDDRVGTSEATLASGPQLIEVSFPTPLREATIEARAEAVAGATIPVDWTGPDDRNDFITAVPADAPDAEQGNLAWTQRGSPASLKLPDATGAFELRYVHASSGKVLARRAITLTEPAASLSAPDTAIAGARIEVQWQGPNNQNDFVTIVPQGAPEDADGNLTRTQRGNPAELLLPDALGAHELRYVVAQSGRVLARRAITLTAPAASLTAPDTAIAGARIEVQWQGPDNQNDFVTIVPQGAPEDADGNLTRTQRGNPTELLLPDALGAHELRYVVAQSGRVLARRAITLTEPAASLSDPGPILPGGRFMVTWEGPDNQNDFVTIVPQGAPEDEDGNLTRTYRGNPAALKAPETAGAYELRYVMAQSGRVLAVLPVTVGAGTVSLAIEGEARIGQPLRVIWAGPGRYEDAIEIVPAGSAADVKAMRAARASQGNPAMLQPPPAPGTYHLRYRATDSGEVLHQIDIEVGE